MPRVCCCNVIGQISDKREMIVGTDPFARTKYFNGETVVREYVEDRKLFLFNM